MRKLLLMLLALAVSATPIASAVAQSDSDGLKPVVVVSISGYDALKSDINFLGALSGKPDSADGLEALLMLLTQGQGLAGLDKERPWGGVLSTDGADMPFAAFLPVESLDNLMNALAPLLNEPEKNANGVWEIETPGATVYLKQKGKWAFVGQNEDALSNVPADPGKLVEDLVKQFDLAARVNVQNVPEHLREMAIGQIREGIDSGLQQGDEESDQEFAARKELADQQLKMIEQMINESDSFTVGLRIDEQNENAVIGGSFMAKPGSDLAGQFAASGAVKPLLSGFKRDDAVFTMHANSFIAEKDREQVLTSVATARKEAEKSIDKDDDMDDEQKALARELTKALSEVAEATIRKGHMEFGVLATGEGPFTIAAGGVIVDGNKLESSLKKFIEMGKAKAEEKGKVKVDVKFNSAQHAGVNFHTIKFTPTAEADEEEVDQVKAIFGDDPTLTIGLSNDRAFLAIGPDGVATIKSAIDASGSAPASLPDMSGSLALAPILRFAGDNADALNVEDPEAVRFMAELLENDGADRINFKVEIIDNGEKFEMEFERGILKLVGAAGNMAAARAGAGALQ